jgi:hypothetical protein
MTLRSITGSEEGNLLRGNGLSCRGLKNDEDLKAPVSEQRLAPLPERSKPALFVVRSLTRRFWQAIYILAAVRYLAASSCSTSATVNGAAWPRQTRALLHLV